MAHSAGIANQSSFGVVHGETPQRSVIPLSTTRKTTMDAGYVVPIYFQFCLPGDVWSFDIGMFGRLMTLKFPLMDNLILDYMVFFEPDRLIWENFEKMQGYQQSPGDSTDYVFPWLVGETSYTILDHELGDYFGLPKNALIDSTVYKIRSGPFRAYRDIMDKWFRDQNYQDYISPSGDDADPIGDGPDDYAVVREVFRRNKRPDYFSTSLPAPQKGPDVPIPWTDDGLAPVFGDTDSGPMNLYNMSSLDVGGLYKNGGGTFEPNPNVGPSDFFNLPPQSLGNSNVYADVMSITANINDLRESITLQKIYELDMRGGTRYTEALKMRWNVDAEDYRLQRPEYVTGGSSQFSVSQVAQNSPTSGDDAMASLAAYSEIRASGHVSYTCVEHGYLMVLVNVRAPLTYQQRIDRRWLASSRFDLPEPLTMNLGERAVMGYEIYYPPTSFTSVWGYQEIWAEYRWDPSFVSGKFSSNATGTLDAWHLALKFTAPPVHNADWVYDQPPVDRVVQFPDEPQIKMDFIAKGRVARQMPVTSIPGLTRF